MCHHIGDKLDVLCSQCYIFHISFQPHSSCKCKHHEHCNQVHLNLSHGKGRDCMKESQRMCLCSDHMWCLQYWLDNHIVQNLCRLGHWNPQHCNHKLYSKFNWRLSQSLLQSLKLTCTCWVLFVSILTSVTLSSSHIGQTGTLTCLLVTNQTRRALFLAATV